MATLQTTTPALRPTRTAQTALAWGIMLALTLPSIAWSVFTSGQPPLWINWPAIGVLLASCALTLFWPAIKPLRGYLLALVALAVGFTLIGLIFESAAGTAWRQTAPWGLLLLAPIALKLIPTFLMALTLIGSGVTRQDLLLVKGDLRAPVQPNRLFSKPIPWSHQAREFIIYFALGLAIFMGLSVRPELSMLTQAPINLPVIVLAAAINAFCEEFQFRSVLMTRAAVALGSYPALWLTSVMFGLGHWYGNPSGPIGVLMAGFLGWFLGKSMLETRGIAIAFLSHFVLDVIIYIFLAMGSR